MNQSEYINLIIQHIRDEPTPEQLFAAAKKEWQRELALLKRVMK